MISIRHLKSTILL